MIVHKVFWAWNDDKEEAWLREMANRGWHLAQVGLFTYVFVTGEPQDVVYCLDFMPSDRKKDEYFQLFQDAGWVRVDGFVGWHYWRKPVQDGKVPEIFTDVESKTRKYRHLLRLELTIFLLLLADIVFTFRVAFFYEPGVIFNYLIIPVVLLALLLYICVRFFLRIRQLKRL